MLRYPTTVDTISSVNLALDYAEAWACDFDVVGLLDSCKGSENTIEIFLPDSDACIGYLNTDAACAENSVYEKVAEAIKWLWLSLVCEQVPS